MIHPTAVIDPSAKIASDVAIGAYTVIGAHVEIDSGTVIESHVVIKGPCRIGKNNRIFQFSSIGEIPQDKKFNHEYTRLEIGDRNVIREFCTFNRGTIQDQGVTCIGDDNLFMAYVHIAHDCIVGSNTIFANNAALAGHVQVNDHAFLGGFTTVFQKCRIGAHSFTAMNSVITKDVPPYIKAAGYFAKPYGLNTVGLKRRGFSEAVLIELRRAYKVLYRQGLTVSAATEMLRSSLEQYPEFSLLIQFLETSETGIIR